VADLAKEVQDLISALPPASAQIVAAMIVNEGFHYDLGDWDVSKAYFDSKVDEIDQIKRQLLRSYVSKRQSGEDVESLVRLADALSKADVTPGFQGKKRQFREDEVRRGYHGRFSSKPGKAFHNNKGERAHAVDTAMAISEAASRSGQYLHSNRYTSEGDNEAFVPGVQNYRRLTAGANFLQGTVGGYLPPSGQLGLHAAGFVGQYGPVAQQALGPAIDRAKYRYTGIERKLDPDLVKALRRDQAYSRQQGKPNFDDYVVRGDTKPKGRVPGRRIGQEEESPSATMEYFLNQRPSRALAALQRASGHQPPSEGIIIDANGRASTQMVGSGDDWYLPFDLRNLGTLKGGQYIRTRTDGGLTTEDIYTGLMAGARQMTVVSHNGIYTMTFDNTLRGSRRYSQAARQMTERYGQLLDAVKNGQVRVSTLPDVDPEKVHELNEEADGDPEVYRALMDRNYAKPIPSQEMQKAWANNFLTEQSEDFETRRPEESSWEAYRDQRIIPAMMAETLRASTIEGGPPDPFLDAEAIRRQSELAFEADPMQGISAMGLLPDYRQYAARQLEGYRQALAPITLNGPGYDYAQQALKEQFPYFIKDTNYIPRRVGRADRGYVMPRYNRSADVQAGYFDSQITGFKKIPANRTRYQNSRITRTVELGWRPGGEDRQLRPKEETPAAGEGPKKEEQKPGQPTMHERRKADLDMVKTFLGKDTIGQEWHKVGLDPEWTKGFRGTKVAPHVAESGWWRADPDYKAFTRPVSEYEDMSDDELHAAAKKMADIVHRDKLFDLNDEDQKVLRRFQGGGREPLRKPGEIASAIEETPDNFDPTFEEDLDFPEAPPGRDKDYYKSAYLHHQGIRRLANKGDLPVTLDDDVPEMGTEYINTELDRLMDAKEKGLSGANHVTNILNGLLAKQLHRYYKRATGNGGGGGGGGGIVPPRQIFPGNGGGGAPVPVMGPSAFSSAFPAGGTLARLSDQVIPRYNSN
jgi:hypothetical protein